MKMRGITSYSQTALPLKHHKLGSLRDVIQHVENHSHVHIHLLILRDAIRL